MAGVLFNSILSQSGGGVTQLEDEDREILLKPDGLGGVSLGGTTIMAGDYLVGAYNLQGYIAPVTGSQTNLPAAGPTNIAGVFVTKVLTKAAGGLGFNYTLGAAEASVWTALGLTRNDDGTMVTFYEIPAAGFTNFGATGTLAPVLASLASAHVGSLLFEVGFTGAAGTAIGNEFWTATSRSDDTLVVTANQVLFDAGLGLTYNADPNVIFSAHNHLNFANGPTIAQLTGRVESPATLTNSLPVNTDTDFFIKATVVPEPTSIAIFGVFGVIGFVRSRRRS
jgi:hypothetical protein